jgi:glycosyltransferase involved in cell wall biosynthesis
MGERRLRVLFLATWYPTQDLPSHGIFIREHALAASRFVDVQVLHVYPLQRRGLMPVFEQEQNRTLTQGLPTNRVGYPHPFPRAGYLSMMPSVFWAYRRIVADGFRPDLIHGNVFETGMPAVILGRRNRVPVVISEHYSAFATGRLSPLALKTARWSFERADRVLPVCAFLRDAIISRGIRARFELVPNAVDTTLFRPGRSRRPGPVRFLFVGTLGRNDLKGLGILLESLSRLRFHEVSWILEVVGDGEDRAIYEGLASRLSVLDRITFTGILSRPQVAERMREATILVLPSRMEMQPCVILEALASGLPVLASSVGGIPEIVGSDVGSLVPPGDATSLTSSLEEILRGRRWGDPAIMARSVRQFSSESVGRQLLSLYGELVDSSH